MVSFCVGLCSKMVFLDLNLLKSEMLRLCDGFCLQAIDMFRNAVEKVPGHVVAQCGLAGALLGRARQCTGVGALAWAATLLQVLLCTVSNIGGICISCSVFVCCWRWSWMPQVFFFSNIRLFITGSCRCCAPMYSKQWHNCRCLEAIRGYRGMFTSVAIHHFWYYNDICSK